MPAEKVSLSIDSTDYGGWLTCEITRSLETVSGTFSVALTERWPGMSTVRPIRCGAPCKVMAGGSPLISGYVDDIRISYSFLSHDVVISGRDVAGDLVDCAAKSQEWQDTKIERIVADIAAPFSIKVGTTIDTGVPFTRYRVQEGETAWAAIERACRMKAVLCTSDGIGNIIICRTATASPVGVIRGGDNGTILNASGNYSHRDRYSLYRVKGQRSGSDESAPEMAAHGLAEAVDSGVVRYRPKVTLSEDQGDTGTLQDRANWECTVARGRSQSASVTIQGWRDANGTIWAPNRRVRIICDWLRIENDMLISTVRLRQDSDGTTTDLDLVHPDTFVPEPSPREDLGWGSDKKVRVYTRKSGINLPEPFAGSGPIQ